MEKFVNIRQVNYILWIGFINKVDKAGGFLK